MPEQTAPTSPESNSPEVGAETVVSSEAVETLEPELSPEEKIEIQKQEIKRLTGVIADTMVKLNHVRAELGLPPTEQFPPSLLTENEKLEELRAYQIEQPRQTQDEAEQLYDSLPESMKTGYFGLVSDKPYFSSKEEAGENALPYILVTFKDGKKLELHISDDTSLTQQERIDKVKNEVGTADNIASVDGVWRVPVLEDENLEEESTEQNPEGSQEQDEEDLEKVIEELQEAYKQALLELDHLDEEHNFYMSLFQKSCDILDKTSKNTEKIFVLLKRNTLPEEMNKNLLGFIEKNKQVTKDLDASIEDFEEKMSVIGKIKSGIHEKIKQIADAITTLKDSKKE